MSTIVQSTIAALTERGLQAEFADTAGGCRAIRVWFSREDQGEILITGEDVYSASDYTSDERVTDTFSVGTYDGEGGPVDFHEGIKGIESVADFVADLAGRVA